MSDRVVVNGAGDDQIYVEGAVTEGFYPGLEVEDTGVFVALSCGVLLKVQYDGDWTIRLHDGVDYEEVTIDHRPAHTHDMEGVREYSDAMIVEAPSIEWAVMGEHAALSEA